MDPKMTEATRLTSQGRLSEAMDLIRGFVSGTPVPSAPPGNDSPDKDPDVLDLAPPAGPAKAWTMPAPQPAPAPKPRKRSDDRFTRHSFASPQGQRNYKLYRPAGHEGPLPLIVMLHGCTQDPDDFAAGTQMNALAEEFGFLTVWPEQPQAANMQRCWNWFNAADQKRDSGEPALIAGITRDVIAREGGDPSRVYIAGLSAGGAAAAILGTTYPDLFAGIGVHSGLACGAATSMASAFQAMRQGGASASTHAVPTIVFHGDRDTTVSPINGAQVIDQFTPAADASLTHRSETGTSPGGMRYTRTIQSDAEGRAHAEHWVLHGAGHAWSGGSSAGSFTAPNGPDASREMVRFFLAHPKGPRRN